MIASETSNAAALVLWNSSFQVVGVADVETAAVAVEHVGPETHAAS